MLNLTSQPVSEYDDLPLAMLRNGVLQYRSILLLLFQCRAQPFIKTGNETQQPWTKKAAVADPMHNPCPP